MNMSSRIEAHPILGANPPRTPVTIYFNGQPVQAYEGDSVAAALTASGVRVFRHSTRLGSPRGIFCGIGHCTDCAMEVDGVPNTRVCITPVRDGMKITSNA